MEVEAKFGIPDQETFQRLVEASSLAGFDLEGNGKLQVHDLYLDTAGGALQAGGYACRLRHENERWLAAVKGLGDAAGAIHRRIEHEVELPGNLPARDWPPSTARELVLRLAGDEPLLPVLDLYQSRQRRYLCREGVSIAELSVDRIWILKAKALIATYLELEAELLQDGRIQDLDLLAAHLREAWGLVPRLRSKFERGLERLQSQPVPLAEKDPPGPGLEPDDPMAQAGRKTWRYHYRRMVFHEPGTRIGEDIEALHDMRVATRRMRAAFRVFGDYFEPRVMAPLLKGLKRTGRALGPARDLDVLYEKVDAYRQSLPEAQQAVLDGFLGALGARRQAARQQMIDYLDSQAYAAFKAQFGEFVAAGGDAGSRAASLQDGEPRPYRARHVAPVAIYERLGAVRAYDEWVRIPSPPLSRLHALRIACKRLRYTLEFFAEILGPEAGTAIKQVATIQDHLGTLQDAVVARALLLALMEDEAKGENLTISGAEIYMAAQQDEIDRLVNTFSEIWQTLNDQEFSRLIAASVSVL